MLCENYSFHPILTKGFSSLRLKFGLHYQSFSDHSRNFAEINSTFCKIGKKCLRELTQCLTLSQFPQTFLTNPSKLRTYLCKIPTTITKTLIV